ncbi:MAG TPA: hypothetical protein PKM88_00690 [bacterium]|nr:hypothetical protein [bacterium]
MKFTLEFKKQADAKHSRWRDEHILTYEEMMQAAESAIENLSKPKQATLSC